VLQNRSPASRWRLVRDDGVIRLVCGDNDELRAISSIENHRRVSNLLSGLNSARVVAVADETDGINVLLGNVRRSRDNSSKRFDSEILENHGGSTECGDVVERSAARWRSRSRRRRWPRYSLLALGLVLPVRQWRRR